MLSVFMHISLCSVPDLYRSYTGGPTQRDAGTVRSQVFTSRKHQHTFAAVKDCKTSLAICTRCFIPLLVFLSAFHVHSSVHGQTPGEPMVSVSLKIEENTTDVVTDQEEVDGITPQDRETMALVHKVTSPPLLVVGTFGNVMTIVIHKRSIITSPLSVFFIVLAVSDLGLLYSNCLTTLDLFRF